MQSQEQMFQLLSQKIKLENNLSKIFKITKLLLSFTLQQVETDESAPKPQKEEVHNEVEVQINLDRLKQIINKFADGG